MTALRIVAEYQMFGDMEGNAWAHLVLGEAKKKRLIQDYTVTGVYPGVYGIVLVCFTVDVECVGDFDPSRTYEQHQEAARTLLNGPIISDTDVDMRWLSPVPEDTLPRDEDGHIQTSAEYGQSYVVRIAWNTDHDGREIPEGEDAAETLHGPFLSADGAEEWINAYPEFTDVEDYYVLPMNNVRPGGGS